ncbi:hypothetical protein [Streptomyces sp. NBC_01276]|uniref:hypothetical protein n=1 Tax=Streptomyces sp. NBC_01276 TaxID=2903808 RepID=UPI00352E6080
MIPFRSHTHGVRPRRNRRRTVPTAAVGALCLAACLAACLSVFLSAASFRPPTGADDPCPDDAGKPLVLSNEQYAQCFGGPPARV